MTMSPHTARALLATPHSLSFATSRAALLALGVTLSRDVDGYRVECAREPAETESTLSDAIETGLALARCRARRLESFRNFLGSRGPAVGLHALA